MRFFEKIDRSLVKSVSFRIVIIIADSFIFYFITRSYAISLSLVVLSNLASTILYFIHERVWNRISWGKKLV